MLSLLVNINNLYFNLYVLTQNRKKHYSVKLADNQIFTTSTNYSSLFLPIRRQSRSITNVMTQDKHIKQQTVVLCTHANQVTDINIVITGNLS